MIGDLREVLVQIGIDEVTARPWWQPDLALVDHHDEMVGLVTYHVDGPAGQIVTLDTIVRGRGFGPMSSASQSQFAPDRDESGSNATPACRLLRAPARRTVAPRAQD